MDNVIDSQLFLNVAQTIKEVHNPRDPALKEQCIAGLCEFAERYELYKKHALTSMPFMQELEENIHHLGKELEDDVKFTREQLRDFAFMTVEGMAVVMREAISVNNALFSAMHKAFFEYFEGSGNWLQEDDTLVSEYYYRRIPLVVEKE